MRKNDLNFFVTKTSLTRQICDKINQKTIVHKKRRRCFSMTSKNCAIWKHFWFDKYQIWLDINIFQRKIIHQKTCTVWILICLSWLWSDYHDEYKAIFHKMVRKMFWSPRFIRFWCDTVDPWFKGNIHNHHFAPVNP